MQTRPACSIHFCLSLLVLLLVIPGKVIGQSTNQLRPWQEYQAIMWVGESAHKDPARIGTFYQRLRDMGITAAMVYGDGNLQPLLDHKFPFYVENMINRGLCLKFHSKVTDWDKFVTDWARTGRTESGLVRDYCLDGQEWRDWATGEMRQLVSKYRQHQPLAYDIRDELSTTISANPFDYDFGPAALSAFRDWLKSQYADVAALNAQWETRFISWDEVKPFTTDQIKNRMASGDALPRGNPDWQAVQRTIFDPLEARKKPTAWNFSPWADFRTYMDLSLARALDHLRKTAHELDPQTPVGIEGTQMPHAFGGYDLWRLSQVLDWVEPYDIGNAREIFGSFMPGKTIVTTVFENASNAASRRLWHLLLEGDRGCIIWWSEDCFDWKSPDYALTGKAKALAPIIKELTSPLARLFLQATRETDPILIHYSQPSIQVDWLLESIPDGSTWLRRFSSHEAAHNRMAMARNGWLKAFQDLGFTPVFVAAEQLERNGIPAGTRALLLAQSWALSAREAESIRTGLRNSQELLLLCEGAPGLFDEHGKLRAAASPFEPLIPPSSKTVAVRGNNAVTFTGSGAEYGSGRLKEKLDLGTWLASQLGPMQPEVAVPASTCTRVHRYRLGSNRLLAFERNISYQMSEDLKQAGGNEALEKTVEVEARLRAPAHVYDLRSGKYLGHTERLQFSLDPWKPSLFALTAEKTSRPILEALLKP